MLDFIRGVVRPTVTWCFALAQVGFIAAGVYTGDYEGAKVMAPYTGTVIAFWFVSRENNVNAG